MASMQPEFEIRSELGQGTARLTLSGELDLATVPRLRAETQALLEQSARHLIIDLSRLTFVDSSGLSLFISLNYRASRENWTLSLTRPSGKTLSVFSITGTDAHLPFIDEQGSPEEALNRKSQREVEEGSRP
jgi:anti-sigma B factor antagonist